MALVFLTASACLPVPGRSSAATPQPSSPVAQHRAARPPPLVPLAIQTLALRERPYFSVRPLPSTPLLSVTYEAINAARWDFDTMPLTVVHSSRQARFNRVAGARLVSAFHSQVHPVFSEGFLQSVARPGAPAELQDYGLSVVVEIQVRGDTGQVAGLGIVSRSAAPILDLAALESLLHVKVGPVPAGILSEDGFMYLWWEFHRDPALACSPYFARPFRLYDVHRAIPDLRNGAPNPQTVTVQPGRRALANWRPLTPSPLWRPTAATMEVSCPI